MTSPPVPKLGSRVDIESRQCKRRVAAAGLAHGYDAVIGLYGKRLGLRGADADTCCNLASSKDGIKISSAWHEASF